MRSGLDFTSLVRAYDDRLRALAFRLLGDRDRMDDVLQEAYVKAYCAQAQFTGDADPGTWLYRIVYNACLDDLRSRKRRPTEPLGDRDLPARAAGADDRFTERTRLAAAFDGLSDEQKAVVWLVDVEGFDYASAGDVLGIAPGTVGSRLSRAHTVLRQRLGEEER
ncbi:MAG TPA: sigma-70 family RNA polymerase sigma factor [Acidimicrobiales bacterium]|nr:sigma-70 family RNA polymerase sigma factor [Acidimicrobiales bacterium]